MKKLILTLGMAVLTAAVALAQNTTLQFQPGKLAVYRGGNGAFTFTDRRQPAFIDEYDTVTTNQAAPILSVALPTNGNNSLWFNLHAGSEGQGISRSIDRQYLVLSGYHGDLTNITTTPSSATDCTRGFGKIDAFTNFNVVYQSQEWFGIQPGITQNNPRGIATDGTNSYWGCGTVAGTQNGGFLESGTLFYNQNVSTDPEEVQNQCESGYNMRIINGVLYMLAKDEAGGALNNGIFDFEDINNTLMPLPWAPGQEQVTGFTNLVLDFGTVNGSPVANVLAFDMNTSNTVAYAADNSFGIIKYVFADGAWNQAYVFGATNLGTLAQGKSNQGCFGVAVDFSGANPVIYATTMEEGDGKDVCSNRLISIVDTGIAPGTNVVANTLAVANGPLEGFRGVDFTPDLRPAIVTQPQPINTTTNVAANFNVTAQSVYTVGYQWQDNGINVTNSSNISGATSSILSFAHSSLTNQGNYTVVITNAYGSVTSSIVSMTVTAIALPPSYTSAVLKLTNFIGDNVNITAAKIGGTPTFSYQWFNGSTALADGPDGHGSGYLGSQTSPTLTITNAQVSDSGSYSIGITNSVGGTNVLVANLTVVLRPPSISSGGQPVSMVMLVGGTNSLIVSSVLGTPPLTYTWYQGNTNPVTQLSTGNEFNVSSNVLRIGPANVNDATNYFAVIANSAGTITSQLATVTVIIPPAPSYIGYSNQLYTQNFDSLPNPGETSINTIGGGGPITIGGITYDLSNPFDFAFPLYSSTAPVDGLGLSNTMAGWYGECDLDTTSAQIGATWGDQTTGGILSFGLTNSIPASQNRALGLIATSTSGGVHFGMKVINQTGGNLNYINLSFVGEYWKLGTRPKEMVFGYTVDAAGTNSQFLAGGVIANATNNPYAGLNFGSNCFVLQTVGPTNGLLSENETNMAVTNLALNESWTPGSALWLVWSINDAGGSGQGFGIDNLAFGASVVPVYTPGSLTNVIYATTGGNPGLSFSFNGTASATTSFTVWSTTNLLTPLSQWTNLGHPTSELPAGTYNFTDPSATTKPDQFYRVTSP